MLQELKQLIDEGLTTKEIGIRLDKSKPTIISWLKKYNLKTRFVRGQRKYNKGIKTYTTHKRISCWELNHPLRYNRLILEYPERDKCEKCDGNKNLQVHHKDGDWSNNNINNLQVMMQGEHIKLHKLPEQGQVAREKKRDEFYKKHKKQIIELTKKKLCSRHPAGSPEQALLSPLAPCLIWGALPAFPE